MSDKAFSRLDRLKLTIGCWVYEKCFAYCVHFIYPDADPKDFMLLDTVYFDFVEKDNSNPFPDL